MKRKGQDILSLFQKKNVLKAEILIIAQSDSDSDLEASRSDGSVLHGDERGKSVQYFKK